MQNAALSEAEEALMGLSDEKDRTVLASDVAEERRLIEEYLQNQ